MSGKMANQREPNVHSKSLVTTLKNLALLERYVPFIVVCLCSLHGLAMSNQIKVEMANPLYLERKVSIHIFCILARGWFIIHNTLSNPKRKSISELQNVACNFVPPIDDHKICWPRFHSVGVYWLTYSSSSFS